MERIRVVDFLKFKKCDLKGKVICFPTDTVYGFGAMIDDSFGIDKIFQIKSRDFVKPLANLIGNIEDVYKYVSDIPDYVIDIIEKYWPGALTIIFNKRKEVNIKNNVDTISFRMPDSLVCLSILKKFGPFATTSVNKSGEKELSNLKDIENEFSNVIDFLIIDEVNLSNVPSTVIDVTKDKMVVIRKGGVLFE